MNALSILKQLFAAYSSMEISEETTLMYMKFLGELPVDELQIIVDQAIVNCKFLPTIAEMLSLHRGLQHIQRLTWVESWDMVQSEIRRVGSYSKPNFDDELTARVVHAIGWRILCASENPSIDRAQFRDMYTSLAETEQYREQLRPASKALADRFIGSKLLEAK